MEDLNEYQTRIKKIDVLLEEQGWKVNNKSMVWAEVDTKQSDFKSRKYKVVSETIANDEESKYADYMLLDESGDPLAIIEAKRTMKDPVVGQKQAEEYARDVKRQTGKDLFIYFTNGYEIWFWNKPYENPRMIKGFHSREDLGRLSFQNFNKKKFSSIPIKKEIIDRPYQIEAVKRILEGMERGKRKFLVVQATGTGKTRVAMALIDVLLRSNTAQKVLFLADRKALRDQAYDEGFKKWFPDEAKSKVYNGTLDKSARLYASTIQTFMGCYKEFSPGAFDIIIADESHRSIYNLWKDVFTYFDAVDVGLTATPSKLIDKDTFRFFQCDGNLPTAMYTYDQAINDDYLAPFRVYGAQTHFQIEGINDRDIPDDVKRKLLEQGLEEDDMNWEGTELEKKVTVLGTNEAIVKEFMDNCYRDETGLPCKSIFFAVSKRHAKVLWTVFEKLYPEYKGRLTRIITSEDSRAQELLKDFKTESFPRIAISVDMLDTGVDIPEVCNLAFVKQVFSPIKFWQMIGRGTRHNSVCIHREWLPYGKKDSFLIFDFWNNFEYFDMHPQGKEVTATEAVTVRIFKTRVDELEIFLKLKDDGRTNIIKEKIMADINKLPLKSESVRESLRYIETVKSKNFWNNVGIQPLKFLRMNITPVMRFQPDVNLNIASFTLKCERLGLALLQQDMKTVESLKTDIGEWLDCLPKTLQQVKAKKDLLEKVLTKEFWKHITYDDTLMLMKEFGPLMAYKRAEPRRIIELDMDDMMQKRKRIIEFGIEGKQEYVEVYKEKVEKKIKALAKNNNTIKKIENDEKITEADIKKLEEALNSPELYITEETLQKVYEHNKGTLVQFIKKILKHYELPTPEERIEDEFKTFIIANNQNYTADQINFLRTLQTVFSKKKHITYDDLFEAPFTNFGTEAPMPLFSDEQLKDMISLCDKLEKEVFA